MYIKLSNKDVHTCSTMGADTVKLCEMQGFKPRLNNSNQTRIEANIYGYKAEFAVARLFNIELPTINVVSDGGVDLWLEDLSIDVKFTNKEEGDLIFDNANKFKSDLAVAVGKTLHPNVLKVNGWMGKKTFLKSAYKTNFGYGERLVVAAKDLNPIETLWRYVMTKKFS